MKLINILFFYLSFSLSQDLSANQIIAKMNEKDKPKDIKATFIMESHRGEEKRITKFISWSQNAGKKQIMWFLEPTSYKDMAFLKIEENENSNMTMWYPQYKKFRKISSQNKGSAFMNSDLIYEDIYVRRVENFNYTLLKEEELNDLKCYVIISVPLDKVNSTYSKHHTWISAENLNPIQEISYDKDENPYKKREFNYIIQDQKEVINFIKITNLKKNQYTTLHINNMILDSGINNNVFQKNILKRGVPND